MTDEVFVGAQLMGVPLTQRIGGVGMPVLQPVSSEAVFGGDNSHP